MEQQRVTALDIEKALEADRVLKVVRKNSARELSQLVFDPDTWKGKTAELTIEKEQLSEQKLRGFAIKASNIRRSLQSKINLIENMK